MVLSEIITDNGFTALDRFFQLVTDHAKDQIRSYGYVVSPSTTVLHAFKDMAHPKELPETLTEEEAINCVVEIFKEARKQNGTLNLKPHDFIDAMKTWHKNMKVWPESTRLAYNQIRNLHNVVGEIIEKPDEFLRTIVLF